MRPRYAVPLALLAAAGLTAAGLAAPAAPAYAAPEHCPAEVRDATGTNPSRATLATYFAQSAAKHGLPVAVLKAIGYQETGWQHFKDGKIVLSSDTVCGVGIMQVTADGRDDAVQLATDPAYNIDMGAEILADKWAVASETPPPAGFEPDDPYVHENWFYAICLYNGCADVNYAVKVAEMVADPFRRIPRELHPWFRPAGFTTPFEADQDYVFPSAFQAQYAPDQRFVFYDHETGQVTKTVAARTHDYRFDMPPIVYPAGTYGPDGPHVTCEISCAGWRLAEGAGVAGRAHWTKGVSGVDQTRVHWTPPLPRTGRYRVAVHVPALGSEPLGTAVYRLGTSASTVYQDVVKNQWYSFGDYKLSPGATLTLGDSSPTVDQKIVADAARFQAVTALSLATSASTITYGKPVRVSVTLSHVDGTTIGGRDIDVYWRAVGTTGWRRVHRGRTATDGVMRVDLKPGKHTEFTAVYSPPATRAELPSAAGVARVDVRSFVQAWLDRTSVPRGSTATISVKVSPSHAGQQVHLQRYLDGRWRSVVIRTLSSTGTTSFALRHGAPGTFAYRVYKPADGDHALATTGTLKLRVT